MSGTIVQEDEFVRPGHCVVQGTALDTMIDAEILMSDEAARRPSNAFHLNHFAFAALRACLFRKGDTHIIAGASSEQQ